MKATGNMVIKAKMTMMTHPEGIRGQSDSTMRNLLSMVIKNTEEEEDQRGPKIRKL